MKNTIYILITLVLLSSCGPHRMKCGARGICKSSEKQTSEKPKKTATIKV
ncbi:hypothetical protein [Flavobacterium xinjiangense]|uniref:Lipoprotein n=1 Tax=Flavobacterium xinjiangense TaxID=178356 RepID=A0A1M7DZK9_9FLAO|nr:hypothetical protein [Flavobacterium xinjiangense]SHL84951.1 hypothetical protein SAMN05216269_101290 [Flavobacterium xinjiangense]